jgi:hypothetical protein
MPIDPNIILGIKPIQLRERDPMEQYAKSMTLRNLMTQGDLQSLQMQTAKRGVEDDEAVRTAYRDAGGDNARLRALLGERGQYKAIQALDKHQLETDAKRAAIDKDKASAASSQVTTVGKALENNRALLDSVRDPQGAAQWFAASYQDPMVGPMFSRMGPLEQVVSTIPQDPKQFQGWLFQQREGMAKAAADQRAREQQAETGRHNRATESTARGNLAVAQGNLTNAQNRLDFERTGGRAPQGYRFDQQGNLVAIPGGPADPKVMAAGKAANEAGEAQAKAQINLPQATETAKRASRLIDEMIGTAGRDLRPGEKEASPHPGFQSAVGVSVSKALTPFWAPPGTDRRDFEARLNEIKGGAFLQAFESLKGGGQITQIEGEKATQAITRMETAQSEREFIRAARDFQGVIESGLRKAQQQAGGAAAAPGGRVGGVLTRNPDGSFNYGMP